MESIMFTLAIVVALGGLLIIGVLLNMIRHGDYSALIGDQGQSSQTPAKAPAASYSMRVTSGRPSQIPAVAAFAKDTADAENEVERRKTAERFRALRKRRRSQ